MSIGKIGTIGGIISFILIITVAVSSMLIRFKNVENEILTLITLWGPGIAAVFGTVSTVVTYYGWFKILQRKRKFSKKNEAKSEAQNQLADFIQSLPDLFGSMFGNAISQVSTVALGASLVASTATYTPVGEIVNNAVQERSKKVEKQRVRQVERKAIEKEVNEAIKEIVKEEEILAIEEIAPIEEIAIVEEAIDSLVVGCGISCGIIERPGENGEYVIQVGLYNSRKELSHIITRLLEQEIESHALQVDDQGIDGSIYSVNIGNFKTAEGANDYGTIMLTSRGNRGWRVSEVKLMPPPQQQFQLQPKPQLVKVEDYPPELSPPTPPTLPSPQEQQEQLQQLIRQRQTQLIQQQEQRKEQLQEEQQQRQLQLQQQAQQQPPQQPLQPQPKEYPPKKTSNTGFFAGVGSEVNSNAKKGTAVGSNMAIGMDLSKRFALGVNAVYSNDMEASVKTVESTLMFRYYLPGTGPFLQAEAGTMLNPEEKSNIAPIGGMTAGWRLNMDKSWFVEPALRGTYPLVWGTGITIGKKFE